MYLVFLTLIDLWALYYVGTKATSSIPFETRASHFKDSALEACVAGGGDHLLANFVNNPIFSSQLNM